MFDVPQIVANGGAQVDNTSMTVVVYLNKYLSVSKNYGMAGAVSVILFIIAAILCLVVYFTLNAEDDGRGGKRKGKHKARKEAARG